MARLERKGREGRRWSRRWGVVLAGMCGAVMLGRTPTWAKGGEGGHPSSTPPAAAAPWQVADSEGFDDLASGPLNQAVWRAAHQTGDQSASDLLATAQPTPHYTAPLPSAGWAGLILLALVGFYRTTRHRHDNAHIKHRC